jgi:hypothetical protein
MAYLLDTSILARLANTADGLHARAVRQERHGDAVDIIVRRPPCQTLPAGGEPEHLT